MSALAHSTDAKLRFVFFVSSDVVHLYFQSGCQQIQGTTRSSELDSSFGAAPHSVDFPAVPAFSKARPSFELAVELPYYIISHSLSLYCIILYYVML